MPPKRETDPETQEEEPGEELPEAQSSGAWEIPIPDGAELGGLPEGTYFARCSEEPKESTSSKGDPQTEFTFSISDPDFPDYEGRTGKYWCSRKPKAWWNIIQTLDAMGVKYEIVRDSNNKPITFKFDPMDCVGTPCRTVWGEHTYEGRTRTRIDRVISATEEVEELGEEEEPF